MTTVEADRWFLHRDERGNLATEVHSGDGAAAWSEGNLVRRSCTARPTSPRLHDELIRLRPGDRVWFTDWRGDADERLLPDGPTIGDVLADLAERGVEVRGLVWRSHGERLSAPDQRAVERAPRRGRSTTPAARCCSTSGCGCSARTIRSSS